MTPAETWYAHFRRDRKRKAEVIETIEAVQREALDEAADLLESYAEKLSSFVLAVALQRLADDIRARKP